MLRKALWQPIDVFECGLPVRVVTDEPQQLEHDQLTDRSSVAVLCQQCSRPGSSLRPRGVAHSSDIGLELGELGDVVLERGKTLAFGVGGIAGNGIEHRRSAAREALKILAERSLRGDDDVVADSPVPERERQPAGLVRSKIGSAQSGATSTQPSGFAACRIPTS